MFNHFLLIIDRSSLDRQKMRRDAIHERRFKSNINIDVTSFHIRYVVARLLAQSGEKGEEPSYIHIMGLPPLNSCVGAQHSPININPGCFKWAICNGLS